MTAAISVIIPTFNYGRFIGAAIEGVLAQTLPAAEIVVIDDGSTDGTAEVVAGFGDRVRYVGQENQGVSAARNRGVRETSGEFIAFLDADDIWEPTKLEKQLAVFRTDDEIGLVHCGLREFDSETGETLKVHLEGAEGRVARDLLLWESPSVNVSGSLLLVRREIFDAAGGFDPEIKVGEDWDFCYRVARLCEVGFVPEALVNYRSHKKSAHLNVDNMEKGMGRFLAKAFAEGGDIHRLKGEAYGNYHRVLAGSYFYAGDMAKFAEHAAKSIWRRPSNIRYFLEFPLRRFRKVRPAGS